MSDLISRQAAIDAFIEILDRPNHAEFLYTDEICEVLGRLPSAEPVRHGKWIPIMGLNHQNEKFICSECKCQSDYKWNFCPNCGADMRGEE